MATQTKSMMTDARNYLEPNDQDISSVAQQLVNGALKLEDYQPIRELERIKSDGDQALQSAHFSTDSEKKMAESLQRNTNGWIDTAKDVVTVVVDVASIGKIKKIVKVDVDILIDSHNMCTSNKKR